MSIKPLVFALLSVVSVVSFAEDKNTGTFYFGLDAGSGKVKKDPAPNYRILSASDRVDGGRLYAGYQISENLSVELGAVRSSDYKQTATNGVLTYNGRVETKNHDLTLFYKLPQVLPGLFVLGGVTHSTITTTLHVPLLNASGSMRKTDVDYALGAGYEVNLFGNLDGRIMVARYAREEFATIGLKYRFK
ncbi:hypothetical protein D3C72_87000 [compost metagenome]